MACSLNQNALSVYEEYLIKYPFLSDIGDELLSAYNTIDGAYNSGKKLLICGNGGSFADAEHIVGELGKKFCIDRPLCEDIKIKLKEQGERGDYLSEKLQGSLRAINLGAHQSLMTAVANDTDVKIAYAQQLSVFGDGGDVLLAISTSGNSENIILAATAAKAFGIKTVALTGQDGGQLRDICDICIRVPEQSVYFIQEKHIIVYHLICAMLEASRWKT